jgi:dihydroorotate dehydrogenase (NAD+) catalytic subunit
MSERSDAKGGLLRRRGAAVRGPDGFPAPWGRRLCEVTESHPSGGYHVFSLLDREGPQPLPGQFYMLAAERHWEEYGQRPFLPRALSVADATTLTSPLSADGANKEEVSGVRLDFLVEEIGPGTSRLCGLTQGESVWINGPLGNGFSPPRELSASAAGAILVGGGIGIAPLALLRRAFAARNVPTRILLGFRDEAHAGGLDDLFACCEVGLASDDGHLGHRGFVTDLLSVMLAGDDVKTAVVYACGPPPMLEVAAALCAEHGVACELAAESPMACGYGACFGCAVPHPGGGYRRLCLDGPVVRSLPAAPAADRTAPEEASATAGGGRSPAVAGPVRPGALEFCGIELEHPVINGSGTFDAIAARRVYGEELLAHFPFSAFVSKTITVEPRAGNAPQRIWETPAGMVNSIGLPNRGLEGFISEDLPQLAELPVPLIVSVMAADRDGFGRLVAGLGERESVAGIELNVSCPNVQSGLIVGEQPAETEALLESVRPLTAKPLIVKLTPNVADPAAVATAAEAGGADAVSLINTLKASAVDPATGQPALAAGHGGLSGPAVRPIAVAQVRAVAAAVTVPVIGMGGITCGADALEFLAAGANLVAVGTESFRDPRAGSRVAEELLAALPDASLPAPSSTSSRG